MTQQAPRPRLRPVIRVCVSSTFSDMKHERNALEAEVYPELEQLCQKNGFHYQTIDLRWGVSDAAVLEIVLKFTRATGHLHPHLMAAANNYATVLVEMGVPRAEAVERVKKLFADYGVRLPDG